MKRSARVAGWLIGVYVAWLGMMTVHEAGHVLHAWLSGGVVDRVHIPLLGFSVTFFSLNPRPEFVAWGGPVWGCVIPLLSWTVARLIRVRLPIQRAAQFFAGFCLVANGAYLGVAWTSRTGDAGDLMRHGTSVGMLVTFGVVTSTSGMYLWHLLGRRTTVEVIQPIPRASDAGV
jgi:hypothetical protein